jgi:hypothetical protein
MKKECKNCRWFNPKTKDKVGVLGKCKDALIRARAVVPFSINLSETMVYEHGGQDCPMFEARKVKR